MAREVQGYLSEDGTFFYNEHHCKHYEAVQNLYKAFSKEFAVLNMKSQEQEIVFQSAIAFIRQNKNDVLTVLLTVEDEEHVIADKPEEKTGDAQDETNSDTKREDAEV